MATRQSNIEAVRILAMLLVVLVHANYFSLGSIVRDDVLSNQLTSFFRIFFEQACIVGVNLFVIISGWFGIKPTLKGAISLLYQVLFYSVLILLVGSLIGIPVPKDMLAVFYFGGFYWFIPAYLCLYAMAPILNSFIDNSTQKELLSIIIAFFILEFAFGWLTNYGDYDNGYSAISFVGLYLLSRYINRYPSFVKAVSPSLCFLFYIILTLIPTAIAFWGVKYTGHALSPIDYCSPFVVLASVFLFLAFQKLHFQSKCVNWIACSVFSVYIIHLNPMVVPFFKEMMNSAYNSINGACYCFFSVGVAVLICFVCAVIDKVRIMSWKGLCSLMLNKVFAGFDRCFDSLFNTSVSIEHTNR